MNSSPDDFPLSANAPEAFSVVAAPTLNTLYYNSETGSGGGVLEIKINVHDWQGLAGGDMAGQVNSVMVYSPGLFDGGIEADFLEETPTKASYTADLTGTAIPASADNVRIFVQVESSDGNYTQNASPAPDELISAWQVISLEIPDPECAADDNNTVFESTVIGSMDTVID
ncbi:MAG TPA: hypothetical protein VGB30_11030 [bacterium]|jgi:hypothetical protein